MYADGSFVGRDAALAALTRALDRVARGRPGLVVIEGVPGMGKTTLIDRFLSGAPEVRIAQVRGLAAETLVRYGVAGQLVRELTGRSGADTAILADEEVTEVGGRLLGALGTGSGPTVLVLDDAQWADAASLHALGFALRRLESDAVLTVIGTRALDAGGEALPRLVEALRGETVRLAGLTVPEVSELAAGYGVPLSEAAARRLRTHTGGLPLHAVALLRELDPQLLARTRGPLPAPRSFARLVQRRLATGTPELQRLAAAVTVLGGTARLALAAEVAQLDDPIGALDAAVAAGLVEHRREPGGDEVRFVHDLVRAAVLDGLRPAHRVALHRRAAGYLDGAAALEQRAAAALVPDPALSAELAKTARQEAAAGAAEVAVHHFLEASRLSPEPDAARELRLDALETLILSGEAVAARGLAADLADDLAEQRDPARVGYLRGHLALLDGRPADAQRLLAEAWQWCEPAVRPRLAALIAAQLSQLYTVAARNADAVTWADRVARYAGDDPRLASAGAATVLAGLVFSGRPDEALARALPEAATATALRTGRYDDIAGRGLVRLWTDDLAGARSDLTLVTDPGRADRPLRVRLVALAYLAETEYRAGRWDDSRAAAELAVSLAADADHTWLLGLLHGIAALPLAGLGLWTQAQAHVDAALTASTTIGDVMNVTYPAVAAATLAAARGEPADVLAATEVLAGLNPANGVLEPSVLMWAPDRIEALVATGRLDEAGALLDLARPLAAARGRRSALVGLARAGGAVAAAREDTDAAVRAFEAGLGLLSGFPLPFEAALLRLGYGTHLRRAGRRKAAAQQLQAALDTFGALGATPYARRAEAELAACGLNPRGRGPAAPSLTAREHAVARLVAEGLTNREIAQRLVVSVKTTEYHLGNVYAKLGVRGRAQLATWLSTRS